MVAFELARNPFELQRRPRALEAGWPLWPNADRRRSQLNARGKAQSQRARAQTAAKKPPMRADTATPAGNAVGMTGMSANEPTASVRCLVKAVMRSSSN
jgi:hypothetical protein